MPVVKRHLSPQLVAVDMGYGHQRALAPVADLLQVSVINANNYPGITAQDKKRWQAMQSGYEAVSRFQKVPLFGPIAFAIMDYFQRIEPLVPRRDRSKPSWQLRSVYRGIRQGWGRALITTLKKTPGPLVTSFFITAYMAELNGYGGEIFLLCCDAEVSRAWAPLKPVTSKINFLAPTELVRKHLLQYGVRPEKIIVTGFPLPNNLTAAIETNFRDRLRRLRTGAPITITFCVGGAGAQSETGRQLVRSLLPELRRGTIKLNLVAGVRAEIADYFNETVRRYELSASAVKVVFAATKADYFAAFNEILTETDILWTKPSELSFYAALGLPIIMGAPLGAQEHCNRAWLQHLGAGIDAQDPRRAHFWLRQMIQGGRLARAAECGRKASFDGAAKIAALIS